ncbi:MULTISPECIES: response regulator transcription factor [Brevibacterium]|uniref:Response regulator transcription factor n=1 Tax=Brevibacterium salitolerans TaxID=1403566 RepID=A0ABN2WKD8_9MICO|nr:response regulator transcription factor [Brevibacterium sp.]
MDQNRPRLLLIDDDDAITSTLAPYLARSGFDVEVAADGYMGLEAVRRSAPDIAVCDVLMPRMDGREFVRHVRGSRSWLPIILLTQVGESYERSAALDEGADDYLNKPFDPHELVSRIRAVLRRVARGGQGLAAATRVQAGELLLDRSSKRVWLEGCELTLTPKAVMLLEFLMLHPQELHSRERLLAGLWGMNFAPASRAIDHRVSELRRVLGDDAAAPRYLQTVPGMGYRFVPRVQAV